MTANNSSPPSSMEAGAQERVSRLEAGFAGLLVAGTGVVGTACWLYTLTHDTSDWICALNKRVLNLFVVLPTLAVCLAFALKGQSWVDRHAARVKKRGLRADTRHRSLMPLFPTLGIIGFLVYAAPFWSKTYNETEPSVIFPAAERSTSVSVLLHVNGLLGVFLLLPGAVVALDEMGLASGSKLLHFIDWVASTGTRRVSFFKILDAKYYLQTAQLGPAGAAFLLTNRGPVYTGGYFFGALSMVLLLLATRGYLPDDCGVRRPARDDVPAGTDKKLEEPLPSGIEPKNL